MIKKIYGLYLRPVQVSTAHFWYCTQFGSLLARRLYTCVCALALALDVTKRRKPPLEHVSTEWLKTSKRCANNTFL